MFDSIKIGLMLNALKNLKASVKSGGKGSFRMKGLNFNMKEHDIILHKVDGEVLESLHKAGHIVTVGAIDVTWDFPVGWGKIEDGQVEFGSEEDATLSIVVQGLEVIGKNEVFELEQVSLEGVQQIQEFFLALPLEEMIKLANIC